MTSGVIDMQRGDFHNALDERKKRVLRRKFCDKQGGESAVDYSSMRNSPSVVPRKIYPQGTLFYKKWGTITLIPHFPYNESKRYAFLAPVLTALTFAPEVLAVALGATGFLVAGFSSATTSASSAAFFERLRRVLGAAAALGATPST